MPKRKQVDPEEEEWQMRYEEDMQRKRERLEDIIDDPKSTRLDREQARTSLQRLNARLNREAEAKAERERKEAERLRKAEQRREKARRQREADRKAKIAVMLEEFDDLKNKNKVKMSFGYDIDRDGNITSDEIQYGYVRGDMENMKFKIMQELMFTIKEGDLPDISVSQTKNGLRVKIPKSTKDKVKELYKKSGLSPAQITKILTLAANLAFRYDEGSKTFTFTNTSTGKDSENLFDIDRN